MKQKLLGILVITFLVLVIVLVAGGLWYYTLGRKPKLVVSSQIAAKGGLPTSHMIAPGEVLLLVGTNATLYDTVAGKEKWSSGPGPVQSAAPPPMQTPPPPASVTKTAAQAVEARPGAMHQ